MADKDEIKYRLPISVLRVTGTITRTTDTILETEVAGPEAAVVLDVIGGEVERTASIEHGWLRDTGIAIELTDDGRLVSSAVESTGQAGKAVLAVAGVGGLIAGAATGLPPGMLAAAAGALVAKGAGLDVAFKALEEAAKPDRDEDKVAAAYEKEHAGVRALTNEYAKLVLELNAKVAATSRELADADDASARATALRKLRSYRESLDVARIELERLQQHFKAWRAGTFKTRTEEHEFLISLNAVRDSGVTITNGGLHFPDELNVHGRKVKEIWDRLGVFTEVEDSDKPVVTVPGTGTNEILFRVPRRTRLSVYEKGKDGKPLLTESKPHLVMDALCKVGKVNLRKSVWAKRSSTLKFSPGGSLTGFASTAAAAGAAFAETIKDVPGTFAGGLEQSKKIYDQMEALRTRSLDQRLARLKKEVELKQQEIAKADLLATAGSHAELERLKQEAAMLEQRKLIAGYDTTPDAQAAELATLKKQIELLTAKHDLAAAQRSLASEAELGEVWREIDRLSAERTRDDLRGNGGSAVPTKEAPKA